MYEMKGRIRYSETDEQGRLSVAGLMNLLQDCCTMQAEDLGIGLPYLQEHHIGWFVTKYQIKLSGELPAMGEEIVVKTWPYDFKGFLGYRNFTLESTDGKPYVMADSLWILMDLETLKPARLPEQMMLAYTKQPRLPGEWNLRKHSADWDMEFHYDFKVQRLHLDTNHHMNNEWYIEAARECLPHDFEIREIYVEYKKSAMLGDLVRCFAGGRDDLVQTVLCDRDDQTLALVEFKE